MSEIIIQPPIKVFNDSKFRYIPLVVLVITVIIIAKNDKPIIIADALAELGIMFCISFLVCALINPAQITINETTISVESLTMVGLKFSRKRVRNINAFDEICIYSFRDEGEIVTKIIFRLKKEKSKSLAYQKIYDLFAEYFLANRSGDVVFDPPQKQNAHKFAQQLGLLLKLKVSQRER